MPQVSTPLSRTDPDVKSPPRFRLRWIILATNGLLLMLNYADRSAMGVIAGPIEKSLGIDHATLGLILAGFALGYAPFCFIGGALSDRFGPRKVMAAAAAAWSVFTAATALSWGAGSMLFFRVLFGAAEGPQGSVTAKTMTNWYPQREIGRAMGVVNSFTTLGGALAGPLVITLYTLTGDWRTPFMGLGILGLTLTTLWWFVARDQPDRHPRITAAELNEVNSGPLARAATDESSPLPKVRTYLRQPVVIFTALAYFGYSWILFVFISWFPTYLREARGVSLDGSALLTALPWVGGIGGLLLGGFITDYLGRKTGKPVTVRRFVMGISLALAGLLLVFIALVPNVTIAVILMILSVFMLYICGGQPFPLISGAVPSRRVGAVGGFVHFIANTAGIFGPWITGMLVTQDHNWPAAFGLAAAIAVTAGLGVTLFGRTGAVKA